MTDAQAEAPRGVADFKATVMASVDVPGDVIFHRHIGNNDLFYRGEPPSRTAFVVPGLWTGMPPSLMHAARLRRSAACSGACRQCGGVLGVATVGTGSIEHERSCPVPDAEAMFHAWAKRVGRFARGRRIVEIPS